jgi:hypothetical protein
MNKVIYWIVLAVVALCLICSAFFEVSIPLINGILGLIILADVAYFYIVDRMEKVKALAAKVQRQKELNK